MRGTIDIFYKDQELETAFAKSLGVPLFLAMPASRSIKWRGRPAPGKEDGAAIVKIYEQLAGVTMGPR
jgi:3-hydroxyisobutyrate dehydrogenase-like beta-hydroxyacid dehydrogenase